MSTKPAQIESLTPLRGIAAILVVAFHVMSITGFMKLGEFAKGTSFFARGYLWVDFFFVLSGFIITHVYGSRFVEKIDKKEVKEYMVARFSRLYPLHFFSLLVTILLYIGIYSKMPAPSGSDSGAFTMDMLYDWKVLPFHFLLLIGFGLTAMTWNVPAWSIGTEWWTYLLALPLFRLLNRGVSRRTYVVPLGCFAVLWAMTCLHSSKSLDITFDFGLLRCLLSFTIGICLYQLYRAEVGFQRLSSDRALIGVTVLTVLLLHFPHPSGTRDASAPMVFVSHPLVRHLDALTPLVFALLILCVAYNQQRGKRLLNVKPLVYLGDISYSIYLMQGVAFTFFMIVSGAWRQKNPTGEMGAAGLWGLLVVTLVFNTVVASMTYRWIEKPARGWIRRKMMRNA